jgi:hypothetical protein
LQDLGFVIDDADKDLGTVSGTKRSGYSLRMTVSIRPRGAQQTIVRSNAQYNLITVEDPEPYQQFFSSLSKALFIEAHLVGSKSAAGGGGTKVKPARPPQLQLPKRPIRPRKRQNWLPLPRRHLLFGWGCGGSQWRFQIKRK